MHADSTNYTRCTPRPLPNDDEGAWVLLRDEEPSAWQHVGGIVLLVAGIALSWVAWEAGWRIGLKLIGRL